MSKNYRRVLAAILGVSGLAALGALSLEVIARSVQGSLDLLDFVLRFTHQSTLLAGIVLLTSSYYVAKGKESAKLDWWRGAATLDMVLTGVVYNVLLNNASPVYVWNDHIMHIIIPIVMPVLWLVLYRPSSRIPRDGNWSVAMWLVHPLGFVAVAWIYGSLIRPGDYLYGFLSLEDGNALSALKMVALLAIAFGLAGIVMAALPRRKVAVTPVARQLSPTG